MTRNLIISLLIFSIFMPVMLYAGDSSRYQAIVVPVNGNAVSEIFILDSQEGHIWTWMQSPIVGLMLIYQGKLRPGAKMGDLIEVKEIFDTKEPR